MKFIALFLLLSVFVVAGCASGEITESQQPGTPVETPEKCTFPEPFSCIEYYVRDESMQLFLMNGAGRDAIIRAAVAESDTFKETSPGSGVHHNCSLSDAYIGANFRSSSEDRYLFILDKSTDGGKCAYNDAGKETNLYKIKITYSWADSPSINHTFEGEMVTGLTK